MEIFGHCFLDTTYADDTTFFLKDSQSIEHLVKIFKPFSLFSGLKSNLSKYEIVGIRAQKGVQLVVCGWKCIDLRNEDITILGTYFSYSNKIKEESIFLRVVSDVKTVWKLWWFWNFTLKRRIVDFKGLVISKIVFQALIAPALSDIKFLEMIQISFLRNKTNPKIKQKLSAKPLGKKA